MREENAAVMGLGEQGDVEKAGFLGKMEDIRID